MRAGSKALALVGGVALLAMAAVGYDLVFDGRRMVDALLGRDEVAAACTPALAARLRQAGFEPHDLEFGPDRDGTIARTFGRTLKGSFTFQDGAAGARIDGILACVVDGPKVTIDFRTASSPIRAG